MKTIKNCKLLNLHEIGDYRGKLIALEEIKDYPFKAKRIYYIYGCENNIRRGYHSHKRTDQLLICVNGSCKIYLDDGMNKEDVLLDNKSIGLIVGRDVWHEMYDFSKDCVLLVLASELYNESDYIRNYEDFLKYLRNK